MFKKLRQKFLILHMTIITLTMFLSFSFIYIETYQNIMQDLYQEINRLSTFHDYEEESNILPKAYPFFSIDELELDDTERAITLFMLLDDNGNIAGVDSRFSVDIELYYKISEIVTSNEEIIDTFRLEGNHWIYMKKPLLDYIFVSVMDISAQKNILRHLVFSFLIVGVGMLIVIFFISRYFAKRSIEPIQIAFIKQKQFVSDASHELKTPLASINANIDVILASPDSKVNEQKKWLDYIQSETKRMTKLTNDLLYLSKMDNKDFQISFSVVDFSEIVVNTVLIMEAVIYEGGFSFQANIEPNIKIYGNQEQLSQLILILLDNALKYTKPQGEIEINLTYKEGLINLSLKNTGTPIPEEDLDRIFDRFYREDASRERKTGGYGLGLAIAKAIVNIHGGNIKAQNKEGKYIIFTASFPKKKK